MMLERLELARINAEMAQTSAQRAEAQAVIDRLTGPESEIVQVEASVAQLRAQRDRDRAAWNEAGCPGAPPTEPADLATQERALAALRERDGANDGAVESASALNQTEVTGRRSSLAIMASADWVQTNGLGLALCSAR